MLTPKQEHIKVFSDQNAYIAQTIIQEPVISRGGTATYCAIPGMDVAAKTGTTNKSYDRWTCGLHHIMRLQPGMVMIIMKQYIIVEIQQDKYGML